MPRKKKPVQKKKIVRTVSSKKPLERAPFDTVHDDAVMPEMKDDASGRPKKLYLIGTLIVLASLLLIYLFKNGKIVSAVVNGKPVFAWQLNSALVSRFGEQTLEGMVTELLIADEARRENVSVTAADIEARQKQMLDNIGGEVSLDDLLKYQGITREEFDKQIRMQLTVERILGKDISITDSEIDAFIASYSGQMVATQEAAMEEEARQAIFEQEISQRVQKWFADIKARANIIKFL